MATRFYLPSTGAAAVSPAYYAGAGAWEKTSEADRLEMVTTKISSAFNTKACTENVSTDPYDVLTRQYVSAPIGVHSFSGCTTKTQIRCLEDAAKMDAFLKIVVRIVSNDGLTFRAGGATFSGTLGGEEFDDGELVNRVCSQAGAGSQQVSQNGDRIVVEIGVKTSNTKTDVYTATMDFGDASGTDLPENETETNQYNPWIEFSHNIAPYVPPVTFKPQIIMII